MITLGQAGFQTQTTGQWASRAGERASERSDEAGDGNRVTAVGAPRRWERHFEMADVNECPQQQLHPGRTSPVAV